MNLKIFALAAGMLAAPLSLAHAMPAASAAKAGDAIRGHNGQGVEQVVDRDRRRMLRKRDGNRSWRYGRRDRDRGFDWSDRRYRAYRGWNRYYSRPYGWRDRGCVSVGPIWFCK